MALPSTLTSTTPAGSDSPSLGDDIIRAFKLAMVDILGIPDATSITQAAFDIDAGGLAQVIFYDPAVTPASGELGRSGSTLYYRITDARTATTTRPLGIIADTSGSPAASIGVGMLFQAESADETPSDFGALDFVASDIGAGTEDTYASVLLRVAGGALDEKYRLVSTAGSGFTAIFTHAATADRTYTFPDASGTLAFTTGGAGSFAAASSISVDDAVNNDVTTLLTLLHTTSGSPAAGIGSRLLFQSESADENPSSFGALDFVATDIGAGTEDTYASLWLRVAGGAIDEKYRFTSTAGSGFTAIFAHAVTADRTYTLPNASDTLVGLATTDTLTNKSLNLANNTLTGTTALFNTALSDDNFATLGGAESVTGVKTFTAAPIIAVEDARTSTTLRPFTVRATTSGSPAASLGVGVLLQAESGDENPSNFGGLDFIATDVAAGTEDTVFGISLRTAGAALGERYRFASTGAFKYTFTGAPSADRILTLPNAAGTVALTSDITASAVTFAGSDTTERTTISTTSVTLSTISTTTIPVTSGIMVCIPWRKTAGAAASCSLGITLNATATLTIAVCSSSTDQVEQGVLKVYFQPYDAAYFYPEAFTVVSTATMMNNWGAIARPNADVTSVLVKGLVGSASITLGIKNVMVYALAGA